jgi:2-hydroxychromene-2-carboxylate isomerase
MNDRIEFYYDFGSPASYLAYRQLPELAGRHGAEIVYRPFLLGGVFKATGNHSPLEIAAKEAWMWKDLERFARRYGVPFAKNPHLPLVTLHLMRGAWVAERQGQLLPYSDAIYRAIWVDGKNMGEPKVIASVLEEAGFNAKQIFAGVEEDEIKAKLKAVTEDAVRRGAFGAPTFFVGEVMFFGQDRMSFVEEALDKRSRPVAATA